MFDVRADPETPGRYALVGELDLASAPALVAAVEPAIEGGAEQLVFDLEELSFIDSTGISALITISGRLGERGLRVVRPQPSVARILRLVRAEAFPNFVVEWEPPD
jgi:anti-sigma B factor antagonist